MSNWEPTVGTLTAGELAEAWLNLGVAYYFDDRSKIDATEGRIREHIAALTRQLESARSIAVRLENEIAAVSHQSDRLIEELHTECDALAWRRMYLEAWVAAHSMRPSLTLGMDAICAEPWTEMGFTHKPEPFGGYNTDPDAEAAAMRAGQTSTEGDSK